MLIDFEKAFDSVLWQFIYEVLHIFGLNESFINWIKLFNNDITAYVLQCGILSESIPIDRGCRQGDPISTYLFILGAEILSLMILYSEDVHGIFIGTQTQFADYTTLILDGTKGSLQASLNILELLVIFQGLK